MSGPRLGFNSAVGCVCVCVCARKKIQEYGVASGTGKLFQLKANGPASFIKFSLLQINIDFHSFCIFNIALSSCNMFVQKMSIFQFNRGRRANTKHNRSDVCLQVCPMLDMSERNVQTSSKQSRPVIVAVVVTIVNSFMSTASRHLRNSVQTVQKKLPSSWSEAREQTRPASTCKNQLCAGHQSVTFFQPATMSTHSPVSKSQSVTTPSPASQKEPLSPRPIASVSLSAPSLTSGMAAIVFVSGTRENTSAILETSALKAEGTGTSRALGDGVRAAVACPESATNEFAAAGAGGPGPVKSRHTSTSVVPLHGRGGGGGGKGGLHPSGIGSVGVRP